MPASTRSSTIHQPSDKQFRIATISEGKCNLVAYNRRDFYKISLVMKGDSHLLYTRRDFKISGPALVFTSPLVPFSWEGIGSDEEAAGYFCVFTDTLVQVPGGRKSLRDIILFSVDGNPVFMLDDALAVHIEAIFRRMIREAESDYRYKLDIIGNYVNLLLHEALKMQPAETFTAPVNASARLTKLFLSLLEKQFPVDFPDNLLELKKAGDFARMLHVHPNHLNAALQEITGKSTTQHISERILQEARSLIAHTDWSIAEIAFSLGFDYVSYFNRFFKKYTGFTPVAFRNAD